MKGVDGKVTLSAVGDIMMGWNVEKNMRKHEENYPFGYVTHVLKNSDITFGNLEGPITNKEDKAVWDYTKILDKVVVDGKIVGTSIYCKSPPIAAIRLRQAGFQVLSIANNHIMDYGESGLFDTLEILSENGIKYVGAGKNIVEARKPVLLQIKGINFGFLAYCDVYRASKQRPGVAPIVCSKQDIKKLRNSVDVVVVSLHQGQYFDYPSPADIKTGHRMIDLGADLVLIHHAHILKGIETYHNGIIAYSLGNFVFDNTIDPSWHDTEKARESMILQCKLTKQGVESASPVPVVINQECQPVLPSRHIRDKIIERIHELSVNMEDDSIRLWEKGLEYEYAKIMTPIMYRLVIELIKKKRFNDLSQLIRRVKLQDVRAVARYLSHSLISQRRED